MVFTQLVNGYPYKDSHYIEKINLRPNKEII